MRAKISRILTLILNKWKSIYEHTKRQFSRVRIWLLSYSQFYAFNLLFVWSCFKSLWQLSVPILSDLSLKTPTVIYVYTWLTYRLNAWVVKFRYGYWLLVSLPWKLNINNTEVNSEQLKPLDEVTSYPYSWLKTTDICDLLYKNTNFFQICAEQQTLLDVQLTEKLPYYLYLTNTETTVGLYPRQFLLDIEPYYYKLVLFCLQFEQARDPLVYVRFAIDPNFRKVFFTQITNEYFNLFKYALNETTFTEFITQKLSIESDLRLKMKSDELMLVSQNTASSFSTLIELIYTCVIERFFLYYVHGPFMVFQDLAQLEGIKYFLKAAPIFYHTIPTLYVSGLLLGWLYYSHILLDFAEEKMHLVKNWWMRVRYFFLTTFNLDIQGDDRDILLLFVFYGIMPYYYSKYMLKYRIRDLRRILLDEELPVHPSGVPIGTTSPIFSESPVLFFIIQSDARNVYYRTGYNHALLRHPELRSKDYSIDDELESPLDLYPGRNVSTLRFIEPLRAIEAERMTELDSIGKATIFSGFSGYIPLLGHLGGRKFFDCGTQQLPFEVITPETTVPAGFYRFARHRVKRLLLQLDQLSVQPGREYSNVLKQTSFLYKTYTEVLTHRAALLEQNTNQKNNVVIEPLVQILYNSEVEDAPYDTQIDVYNGEKTLMQPLVDLKHYPRQLIQQRANCFYYRSLKDLIARYPALFLRDYNVKELEETCSVFYKPLMTQVLQDLNSKKQKRDILTTLGIIAVDLLSYTEEFLKLDVNVVKPTANPVEFLFTYEQLYNSLKETPHLVLLEVLNSEWFDFRNYLDPTLTFEKLYERYDYTRLENLRARVELRPYGTDSLHNTAQAVERMEDKLMKEKVNEHQIVFPADTFLLSQTLLHHVHAYLESKELSRKKPTQLAGGYSIFYDFYLSNFSSTKKYQRLSPTWQQLPYHYLRSLTYTSFSDYKHNFILHISTKNLIAKYMRDYRREQRVIPGKRITYEKAYKKYDFDTLITHDGLMDQAVFKHISKYGIAGNKVFLESLDSMIRHWGRRDPYIQRLQELYKSSRLDAFIELDPTITKELDIKLKPLNLSVSKLYNMSFEEFKDLLDRHRIPTWYIEASIIERTVHAMPFIEKYERSTALLSNRCFLTGEPKQPPVYTYTADDIIAIQQNRLVSWTNQLAAVNETELRGDIDLSLLNQSEIVDTDAGTEFENPKKITGIPLRHLKFLEMYDPRDAEYQKQVLETQIIYLTSDIVARFFPHWASRRIFDWFEFKYNPNLPFLDEYDLRLHNLLQRLEKQFGLAHELAGHKLRTGQYFCGPKVLEYCDLFAFFENIDTMLPKLCVGFSKNDDELDLTLNTFTTHLQSHNKIIQQYELQLPQSELYLDPKNAYIIYAPFTFEELVLFSHQYETTFNKNVAATCGMDYNEYLNRTYLRVICNDHLLENEETNKTKYNIPEFVIVQSMFPSRDKIVVEKALAEKRAYGQDILEYTAIHENSLPLRCKPLKLSAAPLSRYSKRMNNVENMRHRLAVNRHQTLFLRKERDFGKIVRTNAFVNLVPEEENGENSLTVDFPLQNNVMMFPKRTRRIHVRNQHLYSAENTLYRRYVNVRRKDLYLQYILTRANSQQQLYNLYRPDGFSQPSFKQIRRRKITTHYYATLGLNNLERLIFNRHFRYYYLSLFFHPNKKITFIDHNYNHALSNKPYATGLTSPLFIDPLARLPAHEMSQWCVYDYWSTLQKYRKSQGQLRLLEQTLDFLPQKQTFPEVRDLHTAMLQLYNRFVFTPRVRVLACYLESIPRRQLWLPEISSAVIKDLQYKRDLLVLEDLFYILNALNQAVDTYKLKSTSFGLFRIANLIEAERPSLFLIERLNKNYYYPQEILADVAVHNFKLVEKILRVRRILELEYNIKTTLFDSLCITKFTKVRKRNRQRYILYRFSELMEGDLQFLYTRKSGQHAPVVPRLIVYEMEDAVIRNAVRHNIRKLLQYYAKAGTFKTKKESMKVLRELDLMPIPHFLFAEFKWRFFKKHFLKSPIVTFRDLRLIYSSGRLARYRPSRHYLFLSSRAAAHYRYFQKIAVMKTHLHLEKLLTNYYTNTPEFKAYKSNVLAKTVNSATEILTQQNIKSGFMLNFLIPRTAISEEEYRSKPVAAEPVSYYMDRWTKLWTKVKQPMVNFQTTVIKPTTQKVVLTYKLQKYTGLSTTELWGISVMPDTTPQFKLIQTSLSETHRRLLIKNRMIHRRKYPVATTPLTKVTTFPDDIANRDDFFLFQNFNHINHASMHHLLNEVILNGFYQISSPQLASHFYKHLLLTGLELSTGKATFGVWLNWSYGKPVKLWFPIFNNQTMQLSIGAPGLIFLPRLTSYISEKNIIEASTQMVGKPVSQPFLEHKTAFSFLRWNAAFREKELWLQFFIYERFHLLPGDFCYDIIFTFLLYHLTAWELFFKI